MNAKEEFLSHTSGSNVKCASLAREGKWNEEEEEYYASPQFLLKMGYTQQDLNLFLKSIDYQYNNGYGGQNLFGTIWYNDNTWSNRGEYDGSEWWNHQQCPIIPKELL